MVQYSEGTGDSEQQESAVPLLGQGIFVLGPVQFIVQVKTYSRCL